MSDTVPDDEAAEVETVEVGPAEVGPVEVGPATAAPEPGPDPVVDPASERTTPGPDPDPEQPAGPEPYLVVPARHGPHLSEADPGAGLWIGLALGLPVIAWGVRGLLDVSRRVEPAELGRWIVGSALVHDLVVVPLVLAIGAGARRLVPSPAWAPVRWALMTSAVLALVAWPFVRGYGATPAVPSLLDRDYGSGLAVLVGVVWLVAGAWAAFRVAHVRRWRRQAA